MKDKFVKLTKTGSLLRSFDVYEISYELMFFMILEFSDQMRPNHVKECHNSSLHQYLY